MGRKKKIFDKMDESIGFQVTKQQKERILQAADADEMELSDWIREVLFEACDQVLGKENHN